MTFKRLALLAVFALGLGSAALPALAQSSPEFSGTDDVEIDRAIGQQLPPGRARPLPRIDPTERSRGPLGLDPSELDAALGTTTRSSDGTTKTETAPQALRSAFEAEKSALAALGAPAPEASRVVVGTDDRVRIGDATAFPFRAIGWLRTQSPSDPDSWFTCSATLIGPRTLITAAHCIYDHDDGGWANQILFNPGANEPNFAPFGEYAYRTAHILTAYIDNYQGYYGSVVPWDIAVVILEEPVGDRLGWYGFKVDEATTMQAHIVGYPADMPQGTMWRASCEIGAFQFSELEVWHDCDTFSGSSGSAIYEQDPASGDRYVRAVNVADDGEVNYGIRLTNTYYDWVLSHRE